MHEWTNNYMNRITWFFQNPQEEQNDQLYFILNIFLSIVFLKGYVIAY